MRNNRRQNKGKSKGNDLGMDDSVVSNNNEMDINSSVPKQRVNTAAGDIDYSKPIEVDKSHDKKRKKRNRIIAFIILILLLNKK